MAQQTPQEIDLAYILKRQKEAEAIIASMSSAPISIPPSQKEGWLRIAEDAPPPPPAAEQPSATFKMPLAVKNDCVGAGASASASAPAPADDEAPKLKRKRNGSVLFRSLILDQAERESSSEEEEEEEEGEDDDSFVVPDDVPIETESKKKKKKAPTSSSSPSPEAESTPAEPTGELKTLKDIAEAEKHIKEAKDRLRKERKSACDKARRERLRKEAKEEEEEKKKEEKKKKKHKKDKEGAKKKSPKTDHQVSLEKLTLAEAKSLRKNIQDAVAEWTLQIDSMVSKLDTMTDDDSSPSPPPFKKHRK
jgi:hypothetical protein